MKREEIDDAAELAADRVSHYKTTDLISFANGFVEGAEWRINSVWHDASKKPQINKFFVFENEYQEYETDCFYKNVKWKVYVAENDVTRWAYIKDLLPTKEEN